MTNKELIQSFALGAESGHANSLFIETHDNKRAIYSYGYHFPIAVVITKYLTYFNADRYSHTTGKHKSAVMSALTAQGYNIIASNTSELQRMTKTYSQNKPL